MKFSTPVASVALLSIAELASAHCFFNDVTTDADSETHGQGLGYIPSTDRRWNSQLDTPNFDFRGVHKWGHRYNPNGCGITASSHAIWVQKHNMPLWLDIAKKGQAWYFLESPAPPGAEVGLKEYISFQGKAGWRTNTINGKKTLDGIPKIKPGGKVFVTSYQVNEDGAGPFSCRLDTTGQATNWVSVPVTNNCAGSAQSKRWPVVRQCTFTVNLPAKLGCSGNYPPHKNVCILRCQNQAPNGPFGGCIALREDPPKTTAPSPPKQTTTTPPSTPTLPPATSIETETVTCTQGQPPKHHTRKPYHRVHKTNRGGRIYVQTIIVNIQYKTITIKVSLPGAKPTGKPVNPKPTGKPANPKPTGYPANPKPTPQPTGQPATPNPTQETETPAPEETTNPETPTDEPETPAEETGKPAEESETPTENPETPAEETGTPAEETGTPAEESATPTKEPESPAEETGKPTEEGTEPGTTTDDGNDDAEYYKRRLRFRRE
ncbi:hypothetical protein TWF718_007675 [Orbilia javanica]|uniref:Uncharacterized protein n=1 Tax=Orbilia javanica TaxID=47235 RepID=A0AAN8MPM3_9PEZI